MYKYIIVILIILIIYIIYDLIYSEYFNCNIETNIPADIKIHIIITRFREQNIIEELLLGHINKPNIEIFIYNKGNNDIIIPNTIKNIQIINIENIGWDAYGYLDHVIKHYNNLPDYIYNIHASSNYLDNKCNVSRNILNTNNVFYYGGQINTAPMNFRLLDWSATTDINKSDGKYVTASVYPLEKWLESKIGKIPDYAIAENIYIKVNYYGMFLVHKSRILRYPKLFYENLLNEISVWQSEVNHFLERSWFAFYGE